MWVLWGSLGRICLAYGESSTVKNDTKVNKIPQKATKVRAEMELTWFDIYIVTGVLLNYLCQWGNVSPDVCLLVCLSVCFFVCLLATSGKKYWTFTKILPQMYLWTRKSPLWFGSRPDPDPDFGSATRIRTPDPPWRSSTLSDCCSLSYYVTDYWPMWPIEIRLPVVTCALHLTCCGQWFGNRNIQYQLAGRVLVRRRQRGV